ncbi:MAG: FMN-binding protein [Spirochaetia bacterium]|nr:FMN-binding protein [Spirochaetia bacterium]
MRKIGFLLVALFVVASVAGAEGMWRDGTYEAQGGEFSHGWKNSVSIVVENGYIVNAHFDAIPEEGDKMKYLASVQGDYGMVANSDAQSAWYVQADKAAAKLLEMQDPGKILKSGGGVDAISGVSVTIAPHFELAQKALSGKRR